MMKQHLRISALQCNFQDRSGTLRMPAKWHEMGFDIEQLLHTHADMYSAIYDPVQHRELLKEYLAESEKNDLSTIVYMNCHILGPSIAGNYEKWAIRNRNGVDYPRFYRTYYGCCLNSEWKEYFFECIRSLREFNIEGLFFDGPFYLVCGCPACREKYTRLTGKNFDEASGEELNKFAYDNVIKFKDELYSLVKEINPDWIAYFNEGLWAGRAGRKDMKRQLASDDIVATEGGFFFYEAPNDRPHWYCSSCAKLAEAVANGRRTLIFHAGDHKPWGWFMHTPAETRLCYASALANGAGIWYGIHGNPENLDSAASNAISDMLKFDRKFEKYWEKSESTAEIALFYSFDTAAKYAKSGTVSDLYGDTGRSGEFPGNYTKAVAGALAMLEHLNVPYDIITDLELSRIGRYKQLVIPTLAMADDEILDQLQHYVDNGGKVIADGQFGWFNGDGSRRTEPHPFLPVHFDGSVINMMTFNYFVPEKELFVPDNAFGFIPAPEYLLGLSSTGNMKTIARAIEPMPGCYARRPGEPVLPMILTTGDMPGRIDYIAAGFFEFYFEFTHLPCRQLFRKLLIDSAFALENAMPGVAISVRRTPANETVVHLCNFVSQIRPIEKSAELHNVKLTVPANFTRAFVLQTGQTLEYDGSGFVIPVLSEYMTLVLE